MQSKEQTLNKQGRIAADNICGIGSEYKGAQGSSVLKLFDMTIASTGYNEKTASLYGFDGAEPSEDGTGPCGSKLN